MAYGVLGTTITGSPPACRVYNNANISVADNTETSLTFNSERYDTDSMHSTSSLTGRITFNTSGIYLVRFNATFAPNNTGIRYAKLRVNGTTELDIWSSPAVTGVAACPSLMTVWKFAASDYVEVRVYQNSGGALNIETIGNRSPELSAVWVGLGT